MRVESAGNRGFDGIAIIGTATIVSYGLPFLFLKQPQG
jgi:hypothetical protein